MQSRLGDWQLPLSRDDSVTGKFCGPNDPDSVALAIHPIDIHVGRQRWQATGPPGSTLVVLIASTKEFKAFHSAILTERLAIMTIALFVIQLISLVASSLPVRLLETAWQKRFISACFDSATITLLALGLIHLAIAFAMGGSAQKKGCASAGGTARHADHLSPRAGRPHWQGPAPSRPSCPFQGSVLFPVPARGGRTAARKPGYPIPPWDLATRPPGWHPPGKSKSATHLQPVAADGLPIC